jgi:hypothetical protein
MSFKKAELKYKALLKRSFKNNLDIFLFSVYFQENTLHTNNLLGKYANFIPDQDLLNDYIKICQISSSNQHFKHLKIGNLDKAITQWLKMNINTLPSFFDLYSNKFMDFESFKVFYKPDNYNRACKYCSISESQISLLISSNKIKTKRLNTRGVSMEVDRIDSTLPYEISNIVFACYWCNNAKTDEFSAKEFALIGEQIKNIWGERLNQ